MTSSFPLHYLLMHLHMYLHSYYVLKGFAQTQDLANYLAIKFNEHLKSIPCYTPTTTPKLQFIGCSILMLADSKATDGFRAVLVEKKLDTERFKWTKWNDNNGMVDGMRKHLPIDVDFELRQLNQQQPQVNDLGAIAECDEDSDDESVSDVEEANDVVEEDDNGSEMINGINPSEYLQAFTHFTYRFTRKRIMVCDLQGVINTDTVPPTIELTDPAIHYASSKGRRMVYGRTDKGKTGVNAFFKVLHRICLHFKIVHLMK